MKVRKPAAVFLLLSMFSVMTSMPASAASEPKYAAQALRIADYLLSQQDPGGAIPDYQDGSEYCCLIRGWKGFPAFALGNCDQELDGDEEGIVIQGNQFLNDVSGMAEGDEASAILLSRLAALGIIVDGSSP